MNPIEIIKSVVGIVMLLAIAWLTYDYVHCKQELAVLQNVIETGDVQAHEQQVQHENNFKEIENENNANRDTIVAYYDRLLRAKNKAHPGADAISPARSNATSAECQIGGRDITFERACALDAMRLMGWQEWARINQFPIE